MVTECPQATGTAVDPMFTVNEVPVSVVGAQTLVIVRLMALSLLVIVQAFTSPGLSVIDPFVAQSPVMAESGSGRA